MYKPLLFTSLFLTPFSLHALDTHQSRPSNCSNWAANWLPMPVPANGNNSGSACAKRVICRRRVLRCISAHRRRNYPNWPCKPPPGPTSTSAAPDPALYRRSFADQIIGRRGGQPLHALCLLVDWRTLPQGMRDTPQAYLRSASLLSSYPCE